MNFTGGEPTLRKDLAKLIRYGKAVGVGRMVLQTNAIRFADSDYLASLMDAGLDDILVSFHSAREEVSDQLTGAPGTWKKTVQGIENALDAGLQVTTNIVLTTENIDHLEETIQMCIDRFPTLHGIILSPLQPHGDLLNHLELMPSYTALQEPVRKGAQQIRDAGMGLYLSYCENPLCWLLETFDQEAGVELRSYISRRLNANSCGECHLSTMMDKDKVKPDPCSDCHLSPVCFGMWRKYWEIHGDDELRPMAAPPNAMPMQQQFSKAPSVTRTMGASGCGSCSAPEQG